MSGASVGCLRGLAGGHTHERLLIILGVVLRAAIAHVSWPKHPVRGQIMLAMHETSKCSLKTVCDLKQQRGTMQAGRILLLHNVMLCLGPTVATVRIEPIE